MMMDVYYEEFRDGIAVDARISAISAVPGLRFTSYAEEEAFYIEVAKEAGLNGWELDRLLFNFNREVEALLDISPQPAAGRQLPPAATPDIGSSSQRQRSREHGRRNW